MTLSQFTTQNTGPVDACAQDALLTLMDRYERPLYAFLVIQVGPYDAADCIQETFLRAYKHLCMERDVTGPWLYTVARHLVYDIGRNKKRLQLLDDVLDQLPTHESTSPTPIIQQCLDLLSPGERELLYLFDVDGFTSEEIGAILGIKATTVRQRLHRTREQFRVIWHRLAGEEL